jgi:hypothetical protein
MRAVLNKNIEIKAEDITWLKELLDCVLPEIGTPRLYQGVPVSP